MTTVPLVMATMLLTAATRAMAMIPPMGPGTFIPMLTPTP